MLKYPLYDFIATVRTCCETTTLTLVLEMFEQEQCDRLVVLNEQEHPLGLLSSARLLPHVLAACNHDQNPKFLDLQQPLKTRKLDLIQPMQLLPSSFSVEQFGLFLRSQNNQTNINIDWALIDEAGKFIGLVDSSRLLQFLALQRHSNYPASLSAVHKSSGGKPKHGVETKKVKSQSHSQVSIKSDSVVDKPLVQLLERLPWPLMLQTGTGEIVTQNPAWWQQLGAFKDPESIAAQVQAILAEPTKKSSILKAHASRKGNSDGGEENTVSGDRSGMSQKERRSRSPAKAQPESSRSSATAKNYQEPPSGSVNRCFLNSQMGGCTCIVEVQNGQERVWQFVKIPLNSPEFKVLSGETDNLLRTSHCGHPNDLWLMLATDITEQQQLCKELAAKNADLMQLNRLKDEFLACISHELKTPLTAVLGLSRLLIDQQLGELNERQARYAGLIHQSGRHLMSVVNDILDLTRMETGQMELTLANTKISTVCDRAVAEAKVIHTQTNKATLKANANESPALEHQFTLSIEPGLEEIVADELRLRQMLVHLLSNAFKFTETGGDIGLWVNRWEGWIAFTVWDTGIGIPEHQQHLIFQKFQQLENPLTRQFEGTGLGLVLTRALARLHGGDVSFLSREGKGSQFTLLLPPSPPKDAGKLKDAQSGKNSFSAYHPYSASSPEGIHSRPHYTPSSHHPSSKSLVLVVEAVARYIEDLTEKLTSLGYRVVIARSGCEAVEKARRLQPKAIFLNPLLPLLSGWDVLTLLKSDAPTRHIPVIMTATAAEKEQAFANRSDGFLSLPVQHQILATLLESLCATPLKGQQKLNSTDICTHNPLRILRLVNSCSELLNSRLSLPEHRVIEVDDLEQAELLARVWQFDVVLLDSEMPTATAYLQQLSQQPRLATLPLVTCNVATTQAASQVSGLSVFPCLTPFNTDPANGGGKIDTLLSVLQIAAGVSCPPSILVVDFSMLPDLPETRHKQARSDRSEKTPSGTTALGLKPLTIPRGSEWFQALIQYLQTAGFKAAMGRSWAELLQHIRHQNVDLLVICLGKSTLQKEVLAAIKALEQLPFDLPPVLVLDSTTDRDLESSPAQIINHFELGSQPEPNAKSAQETEHELSASELVKNVFDGIATQILPRSISMEDLLNQINHILKGY